MMSQPAPPFAIWGTIIHSVSPSTIDVAEDTLLVIDPHGRISHVFSNIRSADISRTLSSIDQSPDLVVVRRTSPSQFLVPSFIDTHVHAPQFSMRGLGQGLHILDWLDQVTFPHEAKFRDVDYARDVYSKCVSMGLRQGVTTACYFGSLHTSATKILADVCLEMGQRAFVGKTCMDHAATNPSWYREETHEAISGAREVIRHCQTVDEKGEFVRPILTPRFAISCTPESLTELGKLAKEQSRAYDGQGIPNQTHFCEAKQEIDATLAQYSQFGCEADLYQHYGLLGDKSVLAHCTLPSEADLRKIKQLGCGVAHCPIANTTVGGGFMAAPIRKLFSEGVTKIGLGTDSGGGFSCSIMDVMRQAVIVGNAKEMLSDGHERRLGLEEVFYMATLGGARVLGMQDRVGSFEVGKSFDAILVDMSGDGSEGVNTMVEETDHVRTVWEKWVMTGDDRNLGVVWVGGEKKKG